MQNAVISVNANFMVLVCYTLFTIIYTGEAKELN